MKRTLLYFTVGTPLILLLFAIVKDKKALDVFGRRLMMTANPSATSRHTPELRVLAYGDSLTAGTSGNNLHPYAPFLEQALKQSHPNVVVTHRGWPGWTTSDMLQNFHFNRNGDRPGLAFGLLDAIHEYTSDHADVVILLAGTNDLPSTSAEEIAANLKTLHRETLRRAQGKPFAQNTLAIAIPSSLYQNNYPDAAAKAADVNSKLKAYCEQETRAFFHPFPFPFDPASRNWHPDGLHFSEHGYRALGEALAPAVSKIFNTIQRNTV